MIRTDFEYLWKQKAVALSPDW